jgi:hypothetical protein
MKFITKSLLIVLVSLGFVCSNAFGQQDTQRRAPREKWNHVRIQAQVKGVDLENRELTLMSSTGGLVTVEVDKSVARLDEVKVGDMINTDFWTYFKAEFREPTPAEKETPLVVLTEAGKAPEGIPPGAAVGAVVQAVVTIEVINRPAMEVTVKGPRGRYVAIGVSDPELIQKLNVGEVVILTYAEAMALSLEKVSPNTE